jgi:purine nucleoside phosphorylase
MASIIESSRLGGFVTQYDHINFSTAKQKYSFGISKGQRFPSLKKNLTNVISYDLPSTNTKRTCSFGVGPRFSTPMGNRSNSK